MKLTIPETTVEYLVVEVTSPTPVDEAWPVSLAVIPDGQKRPQVADWNVAAWEGIGARLLVGPGQALELACGSYSVWVKVDASPESAIRKAGTLEVV